MSRMMKSPINSADSNYVMLRVALELFGKPLASLSAEEYQKALYKANQEPAFGKRVMKSEEATEVVVPEWVVSQAVETLAKRYHSEKEFLQALEANGLDQNSLYQALRCDLKVEAVLEKIMTEKTAVSDAEVEIYYLQHLDKFELPETRTARHILITINDNYEENRRERAVERISELHDLLLKHGNEFTALAQRHSECPTAMQEGLLGRIKPGQLFPVLDEALFGMEEGELSSVLESPVGLHLLRCEQIHAAERRRFEEVKKKLRDYLEKMKRKQRLHEWLRKAV